MVSADRLDRDQFQRLIGARDECIGQLERQLALQHDQWQADAVEWKRLLQHRVELAEWLIDQVTNEHGRLMKSIVDSGLIGETFVPCTFHAESNGKRYQISLVSTDFEIVEVSGNG